MSDETIRPGSPQAGDVVGVASHVAESARHQTVFREVNENIAKLTGLLDETGYNQFICECSDTTCSEPLEITAEEYEAVRSDGRRFVVVHGHQLNEVERVVGGNDRFLVVEKLGHAAEIAAAADPRHP